MLEFRIADTFTASLMRLAVQEQKAAKTTAFDLQLDPSAPGLKLHKLDRTKDPRFWSVRVNDNIRLIVHRSVQEELVGRLCGGDPPSRSTTREARRPTESWQVGTVFADYDGARLELRRRSHEMPVLFTD